MIDNPYRGLSRVGINRYHDCTSQKIPVPCGNCPTCISLRQSYFVQRVQMESLDHHLFFCTLTYRQSQIRTMNINGRKIKYADWSDVTNMFKRLRNRGYQFSYFCVSEYGGNTHRPHFHFLMSVPKGVNETFWDIKALEHFWADRILGEWRRNYGSKRKPKYKALCQLVVNHYGRTFDFHHVDPSATANGEGDVAFYVTKYLLKSDEWLDRLKSALKLNLSPEKFEEVWKILKPKCNISKDWGSPSSPAVIQHIRKGIDKSKKGSSLFPYFINPVTGQTFPLAPYYQKRFMTLNDKEYFYLKGDDSRLDNIVESDTWNPMTSRQKDERFSRIKKQVNARGKSYNPLYDKEDHNISPSSLEEVSSDDHNTLFVPDDWQNDFDC